MNHFLSLTGLLPDELNNLLDSATELQQSGEQVLFNKHVLFVFEKPSLRTVLGTEVAVNQLGGHVIHAKPEIMLSPGKNVEYSSRESVKDTIRNVSQWCDSIFARVYSHKTLTEMATVSPIPVVNALCETYHPMQAMADLLTIREYFGTDEKIALTFIGDANNVARSLFEGLLTLGHDVRFAGPDSCSWKPEEILYFEKLALSYGGQFTCSSRPEEVLPGAQVVYTDTFVSMGEEHLAAEKLGFFHGYQVDAAMMAQAEPEAVFMHCQPAHRGVEVTSEVLDAPCSLVMKQAFNRMVSAKGVFARLIADPWKSQAENQLATL